MKTQPITFKKVRHFVLFVVTFRHVTRFS